MNIGINFSIFYIVLDEEESKYYSPEKLFSTWNVTSDFYVTMNESADNEKIIRIPDISIVPFIKQAQSHLHQLYA